MEVSGQLHASGRFTTMEKAPVCMRLAGLQSTGRPSCSLVTILTELLWYHKLHVQMSSERPKTTRNCRSWMEHTRSWRY